MPNRAQFRGDVQQLMQFMGLFPGGGVELGIGDGDRPKTGNRGNQRFFFPTKNAFVAGIYQDCPLGERSSKRSRNQHTRRNQVAESVAGGINGDADRLAGSNRPHGQICREMEALAIVTRPGCVRQLRRLS